MLVASSSILCDRDIGHLRAPSIRVEPPLGPNAVSDVLERSLEHELQWSGRGGADEVAFVGFCVKWGGTEDSGLVFKRKPQIPHTRWNTSKPFSSSQDLNRPRLFDFPLQIEAGTANSVLCSISETKTDFPASPDSQEAGHRTWNAARRHAPLIFLDFGCRTRAPQIGEDDLAKSCAPPPTRKPSE